MNTEGGSSASIISRECDHSSRVASAIQWHDESALECRRSI